MMVEAPTLIDLVRELREHLGLFAGAMPSTPQAAWEEAINAVDALKAGKCSWCEDRYRWAALREEG